MDGFGTINPADLAPSGISLHSSAGADRDAAARGIKRARSSDVHDGALDSEVIDDDDDQKPRKRGRPAKSKLGAIADGVAPADGANTPDRPNANMAGRVAARANAAEDSNTDVSPAKPVNTPAAKNVKSLPTMRDHTTDQLDEGNDEYIPREYDENGDKKVTEHGYLTEGRKYRCRTFVLKNRGPKLFMLATECARVLNYRDSYLLFNKNRSLHKIIASQVEKEDLIAQEILPFSYRSRQIAIVTARSMYRQFGAKMIQDGRRVRDDYWEAKARKQGFTEDDLPGEKRPGAKPKEPAQNHHSGPTNLNAQHLLNGATIVYDQNAQLQMPLAGMGGVSLQQQQQHLPLLMPDYGNTTRPRQEITGTPYHDRTTTTASADIINQAAQIVDFNKAVKSEQAKRGKALRDHWHRPHEQTQADIIPRMMASPGPNQGLQQPPLPYGTGTPPRSQQQQLPPPLSSHPSQQQPQQPSMPQSHQTPSQHNSQTPSSQQSQQQHATPQPSQQQQRQQAPQNYSQMMAPGNPHQQQQMMGGYGNNVAAQFNAQGQMHQSPMQQRMQPPMRPDQMGQQPQRNPNYPYGPAAGMQPGAGIYGGAGGYPGQQGQPMWGNPGQNSQSQQPQQGNMPQSGTPQPSHTPQPSQSQQQGGQMSPYGHAPQQSPHHGHPSLPHQQSSGQMSNNNMGYQNMSGMGPAGNYAGMGRQMYQQGQPNQQQHYMQMPGAQQQAMQGWPSQPHQQQQWSQQQY